MDRELVSKRAELTSSLARLGKVVVAYSGGVDSSLLAAVSHEVLGSESLAVTAASPALTQRGLREAIDLATARGWQHDVIATDELSREEYARNEPDRCYWCKTELFTLLRPLAEARGATVVVGTNADDLTDHRPGLVAAKRNGVFAPLASARLTKADVRVLSSALGLPTAAKPASPCLASRFAYGVRVTADGLRRIERAEDLLHQLGFPVVRVRDHGDIARIEVPIDQVATLASYATEISERLKSFGFRYVSLDLSGFRSGSLNDVLLSPSFGRPPE
jgi:pyridinium-3,5-biscarboxylic acid mononucleotide sulfurtransferase